VTSFEALRLAIPSRASSRAAFSLGPAQIGEFGQLSSSSRIADGCGFLASDLTSP
jgi:hypothetical protein